MKLRLVCALLLAACGQDDAKLDVPDDWELFESRCGRLALYVPSSDGFAGSSGGEDSCTEQFALANCTASLDWGGFSDRLDTYANLDAYSESLERIDGWRARLIRFDSVGNYNAAVNLPTDQDISVTVFVVCTDEESRELAVKSLRTLHVTDD